MKLLKQYPADQIPNGYKTIGGTTISAILGRSKYGSPRGAYYQLRNEAPPTPDNPAMERGRAWEDIVAQMFAANHPEYIVVHNTQCLNKDEEGFTEQERVYDAEKPYISGSPDRLLFFKTSSPSEMTDDKMEYGLEIKTASIRNLDEWGAPGTNQIPETYLLQVIWYMQFYPCIKQWYVAVEFFDYNENPSRYAEYVIERSAEVEKLIEYCRANAEEFWNKNVLTGVVPQNDQIDDTVKSYVKQRFHSATEPIAEANEEETNLIQQYYLAKCDYEVAKEQLAVMQLKIEETIGEREGLRSRFGNVTWKNTAGRKTTQWQNVAKEAGASQELIDKYTKQGEAGRTFRFTVHKE